MERNVGGSGQGPRFVPWWSVGALLASWSLGILLGQLLSPLFPWVVTVGLLGAGLAIIRRDLIILVLMSIGLLALGAARGATAPVRSLPTELGNHLAVVTGHVDDDPLDRKTNHRITIAVDQLMLSSGSLHLPGLRVEATYYGLVPVHYGDLVLLSGAIEEPASFEQFDYRTYLAEQGIAAVMPSARLVRSLTHSGDPFHTVLFALRHSVIASVDRSLPEPQAALVLGVIFGYRAVLPQQLQQQMIASGLIHIVVISGLKVSLLARIISGGLGRWLPGAAPWIASGVMAGYALLAGASAAALRAAAMGGLVVLAAGLRRESHVFTSMALTAAIMLGLKPALAHDVSFQLSFAGTLGIASMTDPIASRFPWLPHLVRDPFSATVAAEVATWPLMLANFHQLSLMGPIANALVLPLLPAFLVTGGVATLIGAFAAGVAWAPMQLAGLIASWFRLVIETLGSLPLAAVVAPYFPSRWLIAAGVINGGALAGIKLRQFFWQRRVWAGLGLAVVIASVLWLIRPDGRVHVYALDVGTGSAVLIRTPNGRQILINAGPDGDRFAQAIGRALPPTAGTIDLWLITGIRRPDIGGATTVLNRFRVETIAVVTQGSWSASLRNLVQEAQANGISVTTGPGPYVIDGVTLSPAGDGVSWLIQAASGAVLVVPPETRWSTIPARVDGVVFTDGGPSDWQGSANGFSVIEVERNSRQGLPARAVLRALSKAPLYRTDRLGTVELVNDDSGFHRVSNP